MVQRSHPHMREPVGRHKKEQRAQSRPSHIEVEFLIEERILSKWKMEMMFIYGTREASAELFASRHSHC